MSTARSLLRLAFAGLFLNAMAVACVVSEGDDDDDQTACNPGDSKACSCSDGSESTKKCNASGSGYGACDCSGATTGGSGGGGGEGNTSTTAGTSYGGEATGGSGGEPMTTGGAGASKGEGGSGGETTDPTDVCFEPTGEDCQDCVQTTCCDEWLACSDDPGDCQQQFFNILACAQTDRASRDIKPEDLEVCAEEEVAGGGAWSDGLLPTTKALIDCTGGGVDWENRAWNQQSCNALCFLQSE